MRAPYCDTETPVMPLNNARLSSASNSVPKPRRPVERRSLTSAGSLSNQTPASTQKPHLALLSIEHTTELAKHSVPMDREQVKAPS